VLETVAAVPGMVGATINHLACLRRMCDDKGWIKTLMDEAENERMHLMTFIEIAKPTWFERAVIIGVQWVFYLFFFALYLISSKTAHRVVGYFEEEAVISYTHYLAEIDEGRSPNVPGAGDRQTLLEPAGRGDAARRGAGRPGGRGAPPGRQSRLRERACRAARLRSGRMPAPRGARADLEESGLSRGRGGKGRMAQPSCPSP
jgi:hypothetical protein